MIALIEPETIVNDTCAVEAAKSLPALLMFMTSRFAMYVCPTSKTEYH